MDISVMSVYYKDIAPEPWQLHPGISRDSERPELFIKGKSPRELISPIAIRRAGPATPHVNFLH
jgi:hypothetical protein